MSNFRHVTILNACAAFLLNISELSASRDKPCDTEMLAEVRRETIQEEDDIDVVYEEPPTSSSAFEVEKAIEVLQQLTLFCNEGEDLREVYQK